MIRRLLKSKIHRATVTEADLNYEGSITIDAQLMLAVNIVEFEQVADFHENEIAGHQPTIIVVDENNQPRD